MEQSVEKRKENAWDLVVLVCEPCRDMCDLSDNGRERNRNPSATRKVQNLMRKPKIWASTRKRSISHKVKGRSQVTYAQDKGKR